ncbi:hypothetical protein ACFORO_19455 [Amycolatopsis halotolerans]|uniref:Uncharacterized protein n=1 Tax=Amycolatopsis halotolerans TaxID=330083 RepID=A0ABV7QGC5_9PSEU
MPGHRSSAAQVSSDRTDQKSPAPSSIPELVIPGNMWDKAGLAALLAAEGADLVLEREQVTARGLRAQLLRLLDR